jgi:cytochrome c
MKAFGTKVVLALRIVLVMQVLVAVTGLLLSGSAWGTGEPEAGWRLARQWCAGCHIVDMSGHGAAYAPSFPTIAQERGKDQRWLRAWLISPHPPMPNMSLSRGEIDDVIAYLESLAKP